MKVGEVQNLIENGESSTVQFKERIKSSYV